MRIHIATSLIVSTLIPSQMVFANNSQPTLHQQLGMFSKPSVVRIKTACVGYYTYKEKLYNSYNSNHPYTAMASGFFVNSDGYIVTSAHNLKLIKGGETKCKDSIAQNIVEKIKDSDAKRLSDPKLKDTIKKSLKQFDVPYKFFEKRIGHDEDKNPKLYNEKYYFAQQVLMPNTAEPFPFSIINEDFSENDNESISSHDVAVIKIETKNAPVLKLAGSDTVNLLDNVLVIGYPGVAAFSLKEGSSYEASVNEGKIANANKKLNDNSPVLQVDVPYNPGLTGSPILNENDKVIGMISYAVAYKNSGFGNPVSFAIPTSTIQEFVRRSGAINEQGLTDHLYYEGLQLYWKQDYQGAKTQFEAVKGLFPQHSEVDSLIHESEQNIANAWDKTDYTPWLVAIGAFIAGTVAVLLFVNLRKRNSSGATGFPGDPALATVTEESGIEQVAENSPLRILAASVSNIYRPHTVMSAQTAYIELKNSQGVVRKFNLLEDNYQIGRDPNWSNIDLNEPEWNIISWHHAVLKKEGENYRIYDGDGTKLSTNRILINDKPIDSQAGHLLKDGDKLKIGLDPENQVTLTYFNPVSK